MFLGTVVLGSIPHWRVFSSDSREILVLRRVLLAEVKMPAVGTEPVSNARPAPRPFGFYSVLWWLFDVVDTCIESETAKKGLAVACRLGPWGPDSFNLSHVLQLPCCRCREHHILVHCPIYLRQFIKSLSNFSFVSMGLSWNYSRPVLSYLTYCLWKKSTKFIHDGFWKQSYSQSL